MRKCCKKPKYPDRNDFIAQKQYIRHFCINSGYCDQRMYTIHRPHIQKKELSMIQQDSSPTLRLEPRLEVGPMLEGIQGAGADRTVSAVSFFPVVGSVTLNPITSTPRRETWHLPTGMARLVSAIGLSAALLLPLSSCSPNPSCSKTTPAVSTGGQSGIGTANSSGCYGGTSSG